MRIHVLGKRYDLRFVSRLKGKLGDCDHSETKDKRIRILKSLRGRDKMDVIIHELLHAANWHLTEEFVNQFAEDCAKVLDQLGFKEAE